MTIEEALYAELSGHAGLTALVAAKIYPGQAAQSAVLPYVVFRRISNMPVHAMGTTPTLTVDRYQVTAFATTYRGARLIVAQIKDCLRCFFGLMGGASGVNVTACLDYGSADIYDGDPKVYEASTDFMISHDAV